MHGLFCVFRSVYFHSAGRAIYYRKVISPSAFLEKYTALLNQGRGEEAASLAGKTSGFAAEVTRSLPEAELADKDMVELWCMPRRTGSYALCMRI